MDLSYEALRRYDFSIHDPVTKNLIPVRNSVESRIGQFALSHGLSATGFDQLLELLNDSEITGRMSELTIKSGKDFERIVANHTEKLERRPSNYAMNFPLVVLECVIDAMRLEMGSFVAAVALHNRRTSPHPEYRLKFGSLTYNLRNMSLVHRSWVPYVHSLLHMRYWRTNETLPKRPSPPVASAVRELMIDYTWDEDRSLQSLSTLLGNLPNLRSLSIGMTDYEAGKYEESMRLVIGTIGKLKNLEVLLFPTWGVWSPPESDGSHTMVNTPYLFDLCEALSNLKRLSVLWLSDLQCSKAAAETQLTEKLKNLKAPNLKTLVLNIPPRALPLPGHFLHWIIHSPERPSLENLIISSDCLPDNADVTTACGNGPGLCNLKRLHLTSCSGSVYDVIYPLAQDLQFLQLSIVSDGLPKRLPSRLKELIIQVRINDKQADKAIASLLERSDTASLEKITLKGFQLMTPRAGNSTKDYSHVSSFCGSSVKLNRGFAETNMWNGFFVLVRAILP